MQTSSLQQERDGAASERVLARIAAHEGVDPLDFDRRLYDAIDPDALDALFRSPDTNCRVAFTYLSYEVRVHADGEIELARVDG